MRVVPDGTRSAARPDGGEPAVKAPYVDPFTWVRIAADGHISTLLVPPPSQQREEHDAWLAATTRH